MSMLNFKYGVFANLPSQLSEGTIYVTTDEKAMYADLGNKRIRLSQIIDVATTAQWEALKPPYSTEAFYYIVDANALLKYNGSDWIQLNSTAELDNVIKALGVYTTAPATPKNGDILVNSNDSSLQIYNGSAWVEYGTLGSKILDVSGRVGTLETTVAGHTTDITNLKAKDTALETSITETRTAVGFLGKLETLPSTGVLGQTVLIGEQVYIWVKEKSSTDKNPGWITVDSLGGRVEALKARIEEVAVAAGDTTAIEGLQTQLTDLSAAVNHTETGLAATKAIADKAASDLATYISNHENDYDNDEIDSAIKVAKDAADAAQKTIDDYATDHNALYTTLAGKVATLEGAGFVKADGSVTMTGNLNAGTHKITNVGAPEAEGDAANKNYVDTEVGRVNTAASNAQKTADDAVAAAAAADAKGAQGITDAAAALAKANEKTTMAEVEAKGYDTVTSVDGKFTTLKGGYEGTLADLNTAASNAAGAAATAQSRADEAYNLADAAITTDELNSAIADFATDGELAAAKTALLGEEGYEGTIKGAYEAAAAAQGKAEEAATAAETEKGRIDTILSGASDYNTLGKVESKFDTIDQTIANLGNTYATDEELTNAVAAARGDTDETVASVDAKVGGHATRLTAVEGEVDSLRDELLGKIQTADAMIYRGTVASEAELATKSAALGGAAIGDTYKATSEFTMTNGTKVNIGDLLIAGGTEGTDGVITADTLTWDHVPSGYVADYNPELDATASEGVASIALTSAHAEDGVTGDLGSFQISGATGSNVSVSIAEGNNIAIGMTWGTF